MEYDNKFCETALGLGLCQMDLNTAINPLCYYLDTSIDQTRNYWNRFQESSLQQRIDDLNYRISNLQVSMYTQNKLALQYTPSYKEKTKPTIKSIFDLEKIIFPNNPIRDWSEKKCKEIEEKYKWLDEVEFVYETDSNFVSKQNPASFVDAPKMKLKKGW